MKLEEFKKKAAETAQGRGFYALLAFCAIGTGILSWAIFSEIPAPETADGTNRVPQDEYEAYMRSFMPQMYDEVFGQSGTEKTPAPAVSPTVPPTEPPPTAAPAPEATAAPTVSPTAPPSALPKSTPTAKPTPSHPVKKIFIRPCDGEIVEGYAPEEMVYSVSMGDWRVHEGVDIAGNLGGAVRAFSAGTVADIYEDPFLGWTVVLDHGEGLTSVYANLQMNIPAAVGDRVEAGDILAGIGESACAESALPVHLHFEVRRDGVPKNPVLFFSKMS